MPDWASPEQQEEHGPRPAVMDSGAEFVIDLGSHLAVALGEWIEAHPDTSVVQVLFALQQFFVANVLVYRDHLQQPVPDGLFVTVMTENLRHSLARRIQAEGNPR